MGQSESVDMIFNTDRYRSILNTDRLGGEVRVGHGQAMGQSSPRKATGVQMEYSFNTDRSEMVTDRMTCEAGRWSKWLSMPSTIATSDSGCASVATGCGCRRARDQRSSTKLK